MFKSHKTIWQHNRFIRVLATEILAKISVASMRPHDRSEESQLSSGWISMGSEVSTLNFNSSVKAEQSFAIQYPNVVFKSLCGNLDICLNYSTKANFRSRNSIGVVSVADRDLK